MEGSVDKIFRSHRVVNAHLLGTEPLRLPHRTMFPPFPRLSLSASFFSQPSLLNVWFTKGKNHVSAKMLGAAAPCPPRSCAYYNTVFSVRYTCLITTPNHLWRFVFSTSMTHVTGPSHDFYNTIGTAFYLKKNPYVRTYVRTYVHTYIHTYIHVYIHIYIHTYIKDTLHYLVLNICTNNHIWSFHIWSFLAQMTSSM